MTSPYVDGVPDLLLSGRPIDTILRTRRHELVDEILADIVRRVSLYADLPADLVQIDVRAVVHENLKLFESGLAGRPLTDPALEGLADSAYRRAEEGIPLELVYGAYLAGARAAWLAVSLEADPEDLPTVRLLGGAMLDHLTEVLTAVTGAYLEELRSSGPEAHSLRTTLTGALLAGAGVDQAAAVAGVTLPEAYTVVSAQIEPLLDGSGTGTAGAAVAARRRLRALRNVLAGDRVNVPLVQLDPHGGLILLPHQPVDGHPWTPAAVDDLVARLATAARSAVWAGVCVTPTDDIPAAAALAHELAQLAHQTGRPGGAYRLDDLLLDYQLTRPGPATDALRRRVVTLAGHPDLVETLRVFIETGSRGAAARRLSIHPNTVDYRLGRVRSIVDLDPARSDHLALLRAGLLSLGRPDEP